jgi:hypothetical protein
METEGELSQLLKETKQEAAQHALVMGLKPFDVT